MKSINARIAFTTVNVRFTPRGKSLAFHTRGFIRRYGKTIIGHVWDGGPEHVFYPDKNGNNYHSAWTKETTAA